MRTDRGFLRAEEMLSWLQNNNVIFPSVDVIERTLAESTTLAERAVFSALTAQLEPRHKAALDRLLVSEGEQPSRLAWMLQPPGKINGKNVLQHIDRLNAIESLALPDGIALPETEWSAKGSEGDWPHRKVILYAGLVPGSLPASTRTGRIE